jgi:peptide/nickel transport system substrate-binding protein
MNIPGCFARKLRETGRARPFLTMAVVGGVVLTLAACGGGKGAGGTSGGSKYANGKTFTMILGADPGNLDPHFTSLASTLQTDRFLYDSLVNMDASGKPPWSPRTSTSWVTRRTHPPGWVSSCRPARLRRPTTRPAR